MKVLYLTIFLALAFPVHRQLDLIHDYDEGLQRAKTLDKPIFLLFSGKTCNSVLEAEKLLFQNTTLNQLLRDDFVTIVLYVDDRTPLDQPYESKWEGEKFMIRRLGMKWADLEYKKFGYTSQLVFAVINKDEEVLVHAHPINPAYTWIEDFLPKLILEAR
jgi:thioredoxin-related protein